jgi:chromosome segregation ATPase
MDFREYATKEAAASLRRVIAGSADVCREQVTTLRAAVDAAASALDAATDPSAEAAQDMADLVERLAEAAETTAALAASQVAEEARKIEESLHAELQAQVNHNKAAAAALQDAQAQADVLRSEIANAAKRADDIGNELEQARDDAKAFEAERRDLINAHDSERIARTAADGEVRKIAGHLEKTRGELADLTGTLEGVMTDKTAAEDAAGVAQSQAQAADAKLAAVTELLKTHAMRVKFLERTQVDHERTIRELQARDKHPHAPDAGRASVSVFEDLLGAFEALAGATTISDVLTTMVEHLATGFPRVALFRVKSNHLQGEHQIGFDLTTDISKVVIPMGMDSVLTRAAGSGMIERLSAEELAQGNRVPFSGKPQCAIALPIVAAGETLAIVYADDSGATGGDHAPDAARLLRMHFADALRQHVVSVLARMKGELKALAELRAYAGSLLQEIEAMYAADTTAGMEGDDLQERLKSHLDYARSIYANRAALDDADTGALLDDAISEVVTSHADTDYRHHLAIVAGHATPAESKRAEAS